MSNILDDDLVVVTRNNTSYKTTIQDIKDNILPPVAPKIGNVNLIENNPDVDPRFTDQEFEATVVMTEDGEPASEKEFQAKVEGSIGGLVTTKYLEFDSSGAVTNLLDSPMDPPVSITGVNAALKLTFPSTFPSGQAPDDELGDGTTLTVDVKAVNGSGESLVSSNTLQPKGISPLPPGTLEGLVTTYEGNGADGKTVCSSINLDVTQFGSHGMTWIKGLYSAPWHVLTDTKAPNNGSQYQIMHSNDPGVAWYPSTGLGLTSFTPGCVKLGTYDTINTASKNYVMFTFPAAQGYFDVQRYVGTASYSHTQEHNLNSVPGMIIVKNTEDLWSWYVWHKDLTPGYNLRLDTNIAPEDGKVFADEAGNYKAPTANDFAVSSGRGNTAYQNYVAYLFGNREGVIECSSYIGNGSPQQVNCWFKPQWLLVKNADAVSDWYIFDSKRFQKSISPNIDAPETDWGAGAPQFNSNGFELPLGELTVENNKYIYVAIAEPTVRSMTEAEYAEQALKFTTYQNRKDVKCGETAQEERDEVITALVEAGYDLPDVLRYM